METFTKLKAFEDNPRFHEQREKALGQLDLKEIDAPIIEIVEGFLRLPYCFTLQCCRGHFVYGGKDLKNFDPLPVSNDIGSVDYRIAYLALCIENSEPGKRLFDDLRKIPAIDPPYVQFGCADWFWEKWPNSYALQVEPDRYKTLDRVFVDYREGLRLEKIRDRFFDQIREMIRKRADS